MPAGTLEMGRGSSAGDGMITGPIVAEASASEKFSDKESLISESDAMVLLFRRGRSSNFAPQRLIGDCQKNHHIVLCSSQKHFHFLFQIL